MSDSTEQLDDVQALEARPETAHALPKGFLILFWGLVIFGVVYLWRYSPALGGWAQSQDLEGGGASSGANILATIAFTAIPTAAAIWLFVSQRSERRRAAGR